MKRTPLKRGNSTLKRTPLKRGTSTLKRTPLKSKTALKATSVLKNGQPLKDARSKPLAAHSATSKKGRDAKARPAFVAEVLFRAGGKCQAMQYIRMVDYEAARHCDVYAVDVHEPLSRGRGGSTIDAENAVAICRSCHDYLHLHPLEAAKIGLLANSWESVDAATYRRRKVLEQGLETIDGSR